jgi:hypothetical protein
MARKSAPKPLCGWGFGALGGGSAQNDAGTRCDGEGSARKGGRANADRIGKLGNFRAGEAGAGSKIVGNGLYAVIVKNHKRFFPVFDEEAANDIANRLSEAGVDAVEIFEDEAAARDYASELLENLGVESEEDIEEPTEATFSDVDGFECGVYVTKYYSKNTSFMDRLFSETNQGVETSQAKIEDALENGDEIETEAEIVTPISATEAVVKDKDKDEYTKVTIEDDNMKLDALTEDEANDLMDDIAVSEEHQASCCRLQ